MPVNVIMKPYWPVDRLNLLDEKGECVLSLGLYSAFDKASNAEKYTSRDYDRYCLKALLPDAAYELFLKHPARLRFKKAAEKAERAAERS
jgi:hypothetical protein